MNPVVEIEHVWFWYTFPPASQPVLEDISLTVFADDFLGLVGPNGGGKTTLLRLILGLIRPQRGTIRVFGTSPAQVRHRIGYVPQHARVDVAIPATVLDVVLTGRLHRSRWGVCYGRADRLAAENALERVGLKHLAGRPWQSLSGGQRQRALIARALAAESQLLLLDEPTANIDLPSEQTLTDLLHELSRHIPIVLASHDIAFVTTHMKRVACLNRRLTVHRVDELSSDRLREIYGQDVCTIVHRPGCPLFDSGCRQGCRLAGETSSL
ncbi:MAG: ATP-binding cassette domain-containing protein [Thermoguttaceae bacterium]|nr:ATP-binding cassette domain-containing protein [Thermoguttaceae bacterium]MDW8079306.1 ATP-binding cassette domain-containing protein [Thermoguttaceae bacterium]